MNLDSIHRLIEETQIFQMQQSSIKPRCDKEAPSPCPRDTCGSCLPPCGLSSPAACDFSAHPCNTNKWDICEELRRRELEEVKARAAQMEKTMRWWSDCTANWREKWSKVRAERNSAREEGRQLRIKLEMAMKELSALKKKQSLSLQKEVTEATVTPDLELPGFEGSRHRKEQLQTSSAMCGSIGLEKRQLVEEEDTKSKEEGVVLDSLRLNEEMKPNPDCTDLFRKGGFGSCAMKPGLRLPAGNLSPENAVTKVSAWQLPLEDFQEILWKEREMRVALEKEVERLESALSLWKWKYEELKASKEANVQEPDILHSQHESETGGISGDIKEKSTPQNSKDRVICELRAELERIQAENTLEWDKRELLETEKQGLERENRRLKVQVKEMEELLDRKTRLSENFQGPDFKTSYSELQEKNKELLELRHAYQKLRRQYQVKVAELNPANSPVDQNEAEAKKLRFQAEELKLGLN
ncbi:coiled-coil domain-containing protein 102B isoform X1 [Marmota marmota marmota]|uniref:Coiled-coil domain-containing protein 102B n=1 Tax=Marmota marmota marmota TaxID=9994 RepID=A0A8C6A0G9_MARMA|nr:coiled-coil domain-containing protein 102B isoform X1 [Marmota marmota marmota]